MFEKLKKLIKKSNCQMSDFAVASIAIDKKGNEYNGVNIEYAIPGNSVCAERAAIINAISNNMSFGDLKEIHIFANKENFIRPCGMCRQAIYEASKGKAKVIFYNEKGDKKESNIEELLPHPFDLYKNV